MGVSSQVKGPGRVEGTWAPTLPSLQHQEPQCEDEKGAGKEDTQDCSLLCG